jgi:hypothetical protein
VDCKEEREEREEGEVDCKEEREEEEVVEEEEGEEDEVETELDTDDEIQIILNKDEISTLKNNISFLIDFIDTNLEYAENAINEVFEKLDLDDNYDYKRFQFNQLLLKAYEYVSKVKVNGNEDANENGAKYLAWILSSIVNSFNHQNTPELSKNFDSLKERFIQTNIQIRRSLSKIYDNPQKYSSKNFAAPTTSIFYKNISVKDLLKVTIPNKYNNNYNDILKAYFNGIRYFIAKEEIPKLDYKVVAFTSDGLTCEPNDDNDVLWMWDVNCRVVQTIDNTELNNYENEVENVYVHGKNFNKTAGNFCEAVSNAFIIPINDKIYYHKYYLHSETENISIDFFNWLIQDNGFGKVLRPDSVTTREDLFRNWGIQNSDKLNEI